MPQKPFEPILHDLQSPVFLQERQRPYRFCSNPVMCSDRNPEGLILSQINPNLAVRVRLGLRLGLGKSLFPVGGQRSMVYRISAHNGIRSVPTTLPVVWELHYAWYEVTRYRARAGHTDLVCTSNCCTRKHTSDPVVLQKRYTYKYFGCGGPAARMHQPFIQV